MNPVHFQIKYLISYNFKCCAVSFLAITVLTQKKFFIAKEKCLYPCGWVTARYCKIHFENKVCWECFEIRNRLLPFEVHFDWR